MKKITLSAKLSLLVFACGLNMIAQENSATQSLRRDEVASLAYPVVASMPADKKENHKSGGQILSAACDTLRTTFKGGNGHSGNMFDITAINTITILSVDAHVSGNGYMKIYSKAGTYAGSEANASAWTFIDSVNVISAGAGIPTPLNISINLTINSGQTRAFYVTGNGGAATATYTDGTTVGAVYKSNADIQIKEGLGLAYPFGGAFSPRVWNGIVHYCTGTTGVEETIGTSFSSVVPNPFSTSAIIHFNEEFKNAELQLFDMIGNEVITVKNIVDNKVEIQKEDLSPGVYFYSVNDASGLSCKGKLVVE